MGGVALGLLNLLQGRGSATAIGLNACRYRGGRPRAIAGLESLARLKTATGTVAGNLHRTGKRKAGEAAVCGNLAIGAAAGLQDDLTAIAGDDRFWRSACGCRCGKAAAWHRQLAVCRQRIASWPHDADRRAVIQFQLDDTRCDLLFAAAIFTGSSIVSSRSEHHFRCPQRRARYKYREQGGCERAGTGQFDVGQQAGVSLLNLGHGLSPKGHIV